MLPPMPDKYFTVRDLARYSKLSERQVWKFLGLPPGEALPAYRPGRKVLVKRSEFDAWFTRYQTRGRPALVTALAYGAAAVALPGTAMPRPADLDPAAVVVTDDLDSDRALGGTER